LYNPEAVDIPVIGANVYVADTYNNAIRLLSGEWVAGSTSGGYGLVNAAAGTSAAFYVPVAVRADVAGGLLYVADLENHQLRTIAIAGSHAVATLAAFSTYVFDIALTAEGRIMYVAVGSYVCIVTNIGTSTLLAGDAAGYADGIGGGARFNVIRGLALDEGAGVLYTTDFNNNRIRRIAISGSVVTTLTGSGSAALVNGIGKVAAFNNPWGIALDSASGTLYVGDNSNHAIRRVQLQPSAATSAAVPLPPFPLTPIHQLTAWRALGNVNKLGQPVLDARNATFSAPLTAFNTAGLNPAIGTLLLGNVALAPRDTTPAAGNTSTSFSTSAQRGLRSLSLTTTSLPAATLALPELTNLTLAARTPTQQVQLTAGSFDGLATLTCINCGGAVGLANLSGLLLGNLMTQPPTLPLITALDVSATGISVVYEHDFDGMPALRWLSVANNNLTYFSDAAFTGAKQPALAMVDQSNTPLVTGGGCPPTMHLRGYNLAYNGAPYFACTACPSGAYCAGGAGLPVPCGANTFATGGAAVCEPCPMGTYAEGAARSCIRCTPGVVAPGCNTTASWRDAITVVADGAGSWVNASVLLVPAGLQSATTTNLSCGPLAVISMTTVSCALPFLLPASTIAPLLTQVWAAHAGTGGVALRLTGTATVMLLPPPPLALAPGGGIGLAPHTPGTGRIVLRLPTPRLTVADWTAVGLPPPPQATVDDLAVWLDGAACTDQAWETPTTLSCATNATDANNVAAVVQLAGGAFNVSGVLPSLLLSAPALGVITELQLLPPAQSVNNTINITLAGAGLCAGSVPQVATASVAGVPCASIACVVGRPDAALCVGWNASHPTVDTLRSIGPQVAVDVSVTWVNPATCPVTCDACVTLATRPVLASITPTSIAAAGLPVVVTGSGMMDATRAPPTVLIGGEMCGSVTALSPTVLQCTSPALLASVPGYPVVSIVVVNAAGAASIEPVNLTYPTTFSVSWVSSPATLTALPGGTLAPHPTLQVSSREVAICTLAINVSSCATSNPALASRPAGMSVSSPVASLSVVASGTPDAVSTDLLLNALEASGASGCTGTLTASCIDAVGLTASTAGLSNPTVALAAWRADWNTTSVPQPFTTVPGKLPDLTAVFSLVGSDDMLTTTSAASLSCLALLLPASATPPPLSKSLDRVSSREVLSSVSGTVTLFNGSAASIAFVGLTASAARLNQALVVYAECTWAPTGERIRLPALVTSTLQLTLGWVAPPAIVLAYTALPLDMTVTVGAPATSSSGATTTAACEVLLVNATVRSARLIADAWSLEMDGSASGGISTMPMAVNVTVQAPPATQLYVQASCIVWGQVLATPPLPLTTASLEARITSVLPSTFIASDASSPWPLMPPLVMAVVTRHDDTVVADVTCSLTASTPGIDLVIVDDTTTLTSLRSISTDKRTGAVAVPQFVVQTSPATRNVTLVVECQHLASGDAVAPLNFTIPATILTVQSCVLPVTKAMVDDPLPAFSVGIAVTTPGGVSTSPCAAALSPAQLPPIVCTIALNASASTVNDTSSVFLQNTAVMAAADSHIAVFDTFTLVVPQGQTYGLRLTCAVGGLAIPPTLTFAVEIEGCRAGQASESVTCVTCGGGQFSLGGRGAVCIGCPPAGATCNAGILTLLPHYFRPAAQAGQPLGPDTELHPCYNAEACTLVYNAANASGTASNTSGAIYGCAYGYTGPLCGVCDADVNYARFGEACAICWDAGASWLFLLVVATVVLAVLARVALRTDTSRSDASIVLRITLGYLQAVGSLRVFRAGSTKAYDNVMGWTEVVSASPLSVGALQCILRLPYLVQYIATIALPVLASVAVVVIFHAATTGRSLHCKPRCGMDTAAFRSAVAAWWASKRHLSTLLFVLFLTYMPIVSASLRALDCIAPVAGIRYLRSDLRVECSVGEHAAARALAYTVLIALGAGFPAGLAWLLGTARNEQLVDPAFHATWGFLFDGYRAPSRTLAPSLPAVGRNSVIGNHVFGSLRKVIGARKSLAATNEAVLTSSGSADGKPALPGTSSTRGARRRSSMMPERLTQAWVVSGDSRVWWEAIVLCRKAGVVLLAVTLTNPYLQCVGASLWFLAAPALQLRYSPYPSPLSNRLETASLVTTLLTAIISTALLQYNVGVTSAELHPPEAMDGIEWAVTILLAVMNVGTFAVFAILWLRAQCVRARGIMRRASFVSAVTGRVAGLRASLAARRRSSAAAAAAAAAASAAGDDPDGSADAARTLNPLRVRAAIVAEAVGSSGSTVEPDHPAVPSVAAAGAVAAAGVAPTPSSGAADGTVSHPYRYSTSVGFAATPVGRSSRRR